MPKAGPDQPIDIVIRTAEPGFFSLTKFWITSNAFSETVNIQNPPFLRMFSIHLWVKIAIINNMSIKFWGHQTDFSEIYDLT